jgi:hypothetical protein
MQWLEQTTQSGLYLVLSLASFFFGFGLCLLFSFWYLVPCPWFLVLVLEF